MGYYLGIDVSTTATKALLLNEEGNVVGVGEYAYKYDTPQSLWSEQSPEIWWEATKISIRKAISESGINGREVKGIGLTGQMHGLVLLNVEGEVLRPAILWNDQRTGKQCDKIRDQFGREQFIQLTGNDPVTSFTLPKILWIQEHEQNIWEQTRHILLPKDYVRFRLSGEYATDKAGGSGTIMFDIHHRDWSNEVLERFKIPEKYLPQIFEGTEVTGFVTAEIANELGLKAGMPVYAGGGDQQAGAVGTGAVSEGVVSISLGTSGVIFAATNKPFIDVEGRLDTFCHSVVDRWSLMGVMLSAGGSLRWYRDTFFPAMDYEQLLDGIDSIKPGSKGLYFLPYLTGERTPYADPLARGAFVGLTVQHGAKEMTRAVLEGISFGLRDCFDLIQEAGLGNVKQVRITGGGAKSLLWRQILADVLGCEIARVNTREGAAFGAGLIAAVGGGEYKNIDEACEAVIKIEDTVVPGKNYQKYKEAYPIYHGLYGALKSTFIKIKS